MANRRQVSLLSAFAVIALIASVCSQKSEEAAKSAPTERVALRISSNADTDDEKWRRTQSEELPDSQAPSDVETDVQRVQSYIEASLDICPGERLPRGVSKLDSVSIERAGEIKITIRWAVNDWMHWASGESRQSLEEVAKQDVINILKGVAYSKVAFGALHLEGTLPVEGSQTERVVLEAIYKRSIIEECNFDPTGYLASYEAMRKLQERFEELRNPSKSSDETKKVDAPPREKTLVTTSNVLNLAESRRIHPELRRRYL